MLRWLSLFIATVFHRKTPLSAKTLLGAGILYGLLPADLVPDLLPLVGQSDDLVAIILVALFFWWKTRHVRAELREEPQAPPSK